MKNLKSLSKIVWDNVFEGMPVPPLTQTPTNKQLVKYAGASGDFYEIHYDRDYAMETGLPGIIVHGAFKSALLAQMITNWTGSSITIKKLGCQYRDIDQPGNPITYKGQVSRKYVKNGQHLVDLEIWSENKNKKKTTLGWAVIELPRI